MGSRRLGWDDGSLGWGGGSSDGKMVGFGFHRIGELCDFPRF